MNKICGGGLRRLLPFTYAMKGNWIFSPYGHAFFLPDFSLRMLCWKWVMQHIVIRLSLGKLLVNLLQVVKRTNTPLIP